MVLSGDEMTTPGVPWLSFGRGKTLTLDDFGLMTSSWLLESVIRMSPLGVMAKSVGYPFTGICFSGARLIASTTWIYSFA